MMKPDSYISPVGRGDDFGKEVEQALQVKISQFQQNFIQRSRDSRFSERKPTPMTPCFCQCLLPTVLYNVNDTGLSQNIEHRAK